MLRGQTKYFMRMVIFISEILQFKSEHDANKQALHEHDKVVIQEKPESIMVNRNQYNMGSESGDGFSFNTKNDDINPIVKDEGFEFRYNKFPIFITRFNIKDKELFVGRENYLSKYL